MMNRPCPRCGGGPVKWMKRFPRIWRVVGHQASPGNQMVPMRKLFLGKEIRAYVCQACGWKDRKGKYERDNRLVAPGSLVSPPPTVSLVGKLKARLGIGN